MTKHQTAIVAITAYDRTHFFTLSTRTPRYWQPLALIRWRCGDVTGTSCAWCPLEKSRNVTELLYKAWVGKSWTGERNYFVTEGFRIYHFWIYCQEWTDNAKDRFLSATVRQVHFMADEFVMKFWSVCWNMWWQQLHLKQLTVLLFITQLCTTPSFHSVLQWQQSYEYLIKKASSNAMWQCKN